MPTAGAYLTSWFPPPYLDHLLAAQAAHIRQDDHELGEAQIAYLPPPQLLHATQVEGFKPQPIVFVTQGKGQFELRVAPLVGDSIVGKSQMTLHFPAII